MKKERAATLSVRRLREADLSRVGEIAREAFSTPWQEATFRGLLRRADTDMLAAELDGRLVGYAICWTILDQAELGNVAVAADARGLGAGRRLVEAVIETLLRRGARECFLEVRESNLVAQGLYERIGFELVGRRRAYYNAPVEDALVMRIHLARPA
jgi:ribosomal-protein-alanine N-acetyltransferase